MGPQFVLTVAFDAFVSAGVFTGMTVGTHRKVERKNFAFFSTHATGNYQLRVVCVHSHRDCYSVKLRGNFGQAVGFRPYPEVVVTKFPETFSPQSGEEET